jgi:hypothetical protein
MLVNAHRKRGVAVLSLLVVLSKPLSVLMVKKASRVSKCGLFFEETCRFSIYIGEQNKVYIESCDVICSQV